MAAVMTRKQPVAVAAPQLGTATRKYAVEAIGTFCLVSPVAASVLSHSPLTPLAAGAVLMVMIYAGGHISGGHYNPAVTIAALTRGRIAFGEAVGYWIAQLVAGLVAALVVCATVTTSQAHTLTLHGSAFASALVVELLFTFALTYVVLNVATSKDHPDNSFYGLAIGFTVLAGAVAVGGLSGGAFHPRVTAGAAGRR